MTARATLTALGARSRLRRRPGLQPAQEDFAGLGFFLIRGRESTMNNKPTYISKDGLEKLRHELEEMVSVTRPEIAQRIHDAKEHGDLSERAGSRRSRR
jgi:hypothetical protein